MKYFKLCVFSLISFLFIGLVNVNAEEYVAKIGDKSYSFQEFLVALTQTKANDKVVILDDIDLTNVFPEIPEGQNANYVPLADGVSFDLNGHSITTNNHSLTYVGNNITIKNGKFIVKGYGTENEGSYSLFLGRLSQASSGYVLEDLVLEGGLNVHNAKEVVLKNVTATGTNYYAVWAGFDSDITIKSGSYSSKSGVILNAQHDYNGGITVEGGTFNDFVPGIYVAPGSEVTVKLTKDITLKETMVVSNNLTIDLNGHSVKGKSLLFEVYGAKLNIIGKGSLEETEPNYAPIAVYGSATNDNNFKSIVNVGKDVTLKGWSGIMVRQHSKFSGKTANSNNAYGVEVNVAGKIISVNDTAGGSGFGIYVNGYISNKTNAPVINVENTANITSTGLGVFGGGYSTINILGGTIVGDESGIEIRAGKLYIKDGDISTTANELKVKSNGSGSTTIGAGIAVAQHTTAQDLKVEILGGNVSGKVALNVANPENKTAEEQQLVSVVVKGGTYNTDVDKELIAAGLVSKKIGSMYTVGKENTVTIGKVTGGTLEIDKNKAIEGETVTLTLKPEDGYKVSNIKVLDADNKEVTVSDNTFVMPNSNVKIDVVYEKIIIVTELPVVDTKEEVKKPTVAVKEETRVEEVLKESLDKNEELAEIVEKENVKVELSITEIKVAEKSEEAIKEVAGNAVIATYFDININVKKVTDGTLLGTLSNLTKEIELMIVLPENLKNTDNKINREYFVIREHIENGKTEVEKIKANLSEDGNYLIFKTDKFSTYALAYEDTAGIPSVPQTGDSVSLYIILGFISVAAIGISLNSLKRRTSR